MENNLEFKGGSMNYEKEEVKVDKCYCCHQEKEGTYLDVIIENKVISRELSERRFVCNSCNHLNSKENRSN